jgi:hypothetical protein
MIPTLTSLEVVNRALVEIAQGVPLPSGTVGSNFDGSANGIYAAELYQGAVQMLLRQQDYEFSRELVVLSPGSSNPNILGWTNVYVYPTYAVRIRQLVPVSYDITDPQPIRWDTGFDGFQQVIYTNLPAAEAVITSNLVTEGMWDDSFTEQMVRYLGSQLAIPVAGRPDFSEKMLDWSGRIGGANMDRDS